MGFLEVSGIQVQEEGNIVLQDINFTLQEGQKLAIAGETGAGKSTLLQTIAGLVQPVAGQVFFADQKVEGPQDVLVPGHPGIAYLSQHFELPQFLRVEQVLKYANTLEDDAARRVSQICRIDHLLQRRTNQLSGGEKQRIALARLLVSWPDLLLLDEPFSNLDSSHKSTLKSVIQEIGDELGITCVLISHDPHDTLSWADTIMVLQNGKLVQQGTPEQLYKEPVNAYVARLFGDYNQLSSATMHGLGIVPVKGLKPIVRPEGVTLAQQPDGNGIVVKSSYFGSFSEVSVQLGNDLIKVRTNATNVKQGDKVSLIIAPDQICYI